MSERLPAGQIETALAVFVLLCAIVLLGCAVLWRIEKLEKQLGLKMEKNGKYVQIEVKK